MADLCYRVRTPRLPQDLSVFPEVVRRLQQVPSSVFEIIRAKNRFGAEYNVRPSCRAAPSIAPRSNYSPACPAIAMRSASSPCRRVIATHPHLELLLRHLVCSTPQAKRSAGYRDYQVLARGPDGWMVELQRIPAECLAVKNDLGHEEYTNYRFVLEAANRARANTP